MNSREKNARIVCRMKSVDVTRVIPRRCAASVASVDLPVPVAPPTSKTTGSSRCCNACSRRRRRIVRPASGSPSTSPGDLRQPVEVELERAPLHHVRVGATGELVGAGRRQARRRERAGHQSLRPWRPLVAAERQRCQIAALAHTPTAASEIASVAIRSSSRSRSGSPASGTTSFAGEDDRESRAWPPLRRRRRSLPP